MGFSPVPLVAAALALACLGDVALVFCFVLFLGILLFLFLFFAWLVFLSSWFLLWT